MVHVVLIRYNLVFTAERDGYGQPVNPARTSPHTRRWLSPVRVDRLFHRAAPWHCAGAGARSFTDRCWRSVADSHPDVSGCCHGYEDHRGPGTPRLLSSRDRRRRVRLSAPLARRSAGPAISRYSCGRPRAVSRLRPSWLSHGGLLLRTP